MILEKTIPQNQTRIELINTLMDEIGIPASVRDDTQYLTRDELILIITVLRGQRDKINKYEELFSRI